MERIFDGEVYDIIAQPNGMVFAYCKDTIEDNVIVRYKMFSFETGTLSDVAKNIYQLSKYGSNYRAITTLCNNYVSARSVFLPSGKVFVLEDNGRAVLFDEDGLPVWTGELLYRGNPPSDIVFHRNSIWGSFPDTNVLLRFNLSTMREELRIGGNTSPFNKPSKLFVEGDEVYICNNGSDKIIKINLNSYNVSDYMEFTEPVYSYLKCKNGEFFLMESGIYKL